MRIAALFDMFGPYHIARLDALGRCGPTLGLEVASRSKVYAWDRQCRETAFERRTLFDVEDSSGVAIDVLSTRLFAELDSWNPDVVLVPGWSAPFAHAALRWCLANRCPPVLMSESTQGDHRRYAPKEAIKRAVISGFSASLAGGPSHKTYLEALGMDASEIFLGYNAVDNAHFAHGAAAARTEGEWLRERMGLPRRFVLASSRFIEIKNIPRLVKAFARFRCQFDGEDTSLVVLGDGVERATIEAARASLGLEEHVLLPGFRQYNELPVYYALADAFVHVSRVEPWGLVVNEAMAAGLPVIVSRQCGCVETLVENERNGFVVEYDDIAGIAAALGRIEANVELRAKMAARSVEIVAAWGPDRFAEGALAAARFALQRGMRDLNLTQRLALSAVQRFS